MPCCTTVLDVLNKLQCTSKILIITNPHVPWHVSRPLFERVIFRFHGSFIAAGFLFSTPLALLNNICSSFLFANSVFRWISAVCHRLPLFTGRCCCYGYFVMPVGSENKGPSRSVVEDQYRDLVHLVEVLASPATVKTKSRTSIQTNGYGVFGSPESSRETSPARSSVVLGLTETQALEQFSKAYQSERDFSQHPHKAVFLQVTKYVVTLCTEMHPSCLMYWRDASS
jgi:hypothetical protein